MRAHKRRFLVLVAMSGSLALAATAAHAGEVRYRVVDLGSLTGFQSTYGAAVNDLGHAVVVGYSPPPPVESYRSFLHNGRGRVDLGSLGRSRTIGWGINNRDEIVGSIDTPSGTRAFVWRRGAFDLLTALGMDRTWSFDINDSGQVAGGMDHTNGTTQAMLWQADGTPLNLGSLGQPYSNAIALNRFGDAVGYAMNASYRFHAFLSVYGVMHDLGTLPSGGSSFAYDINDVGQVIGVSGRENEPFLWERGEMTPLPTRPETTLRPRAINNHGQIVGHMSHRPYRPYPQAAFWENGELFDLNDLISPSSDWAITNAYDINDAGQIAAQGMLNGRTHAVLLTPVPEPSGLLAALFGSGVFGRSLLRRRRPQ